MIHAISLGYVPSRIWEQSCSQFYKTISRIVPINHVFLNQHYPLREVENEKENRKICDRFGIAWMDSGRNLGLHNGFNYCLNNLSLAPDDVVIGFDPDSCPETPGWDMALVTAFLDKTVAWASLMAPWIDEHIDRITERSYLINQVQAIKIREPIMNSICAWSGEYLLGTKGLHENLEWYGTLEVAMWSKLQSLKKSWVFLPGWRENHSLHIQQDHEYLRWKWYYAHCRMIDYDFGEYVRRGCPVMEEVPSGFR